MSEAYSPPDYSDGEDVEEFIEERREGLEEVIDRNLPFAPYAQNLLDSIDGGGGD